MLSIEARFLIRQAQAESLGEIRRELEDGIQSLQQEQKSRSKVIMSVGVAGGVLLSILFFIGRIEHDRLNTFKIAAVGILITVLNQVLKHSGREDQAFLCSWQDWYWVLMWLILISMTCCHDAGAVLIG